MDCSLLGGTAKINRWQSISAVDGRLREKLTVGDRFWPLAVDFSRRRSIEGEIDRRRLIEGEEGKKKKKWKIRKKKRRRRKKYLLSPCHPRPRVVAARGRFFSCARRRNVLELLDVVQFRSPDIAIQCPRLLSTFNIDVQVNDLLKNSSTSEMGGFTGTWIVHYWTVPPKIDRRRSIEGESIVGGRLREIGDRRKREEEEEEEKKKRRRNKTSIVAAHGSLACCSRPLVARGRFFSRARRRYISPRGEKDRGDIAEPFS
ncbi:hypothetical protein GW17_00012815 [Ensete ventricosum]|nr:hypothetical protein GW17_00012815 [Ensete ventricosum]RZR94478.1 hypothetical protein BHM03_00023166 [Ensete ventricosum]